MPTRKRSAAEWAKAMRLAGRMEAQNLDRIRASGLTFKRTITSADCCAVCRANKDQGAIPVDEPFLSGHIHAPFCSRCRCATSGARAPE